MAIKGFDPKWKDFPDYILGVTKEIWEDRGIATLNHYYAKDIVVRSPASVVIGNDNVIAATMATLAEFPDRQLPGEDVIWCGSPEDGSLLSSHRLISFATHLRDGAYGAASGKKFVYRIIAECAARDDQIYDEWIIRDQGAIVRQLGVDPKTFAVQQIAREGGAAKCKKPLSPKTDVKGRYKGKGNTVAIGQRYAEMLQKLMAADFRIINNDYDRACHLEYPGGQSLHGQAAADQFWMGLRAAFPNAKFQIEHQIGREDAGMPPRAAIRWSLWGKHEGWGAFGAPSGADVYVLGLSHAEFGPWGLRREYVLYDETAIWKQIALKTG